jgi:hypothetical protein
MQTINIWYKLHIHSKKSLGVFIFFLLFMVSLHGQSQNFKTVNLPNSDERRLHYGFLIGGHTSAFRTKYSPNFVRDSVSYNGSIIDMDSVTAIEGQYRAGFSLGFILNVKLNDYLDFRFLPQVAFYEREVIYSYESQEDNGQLLEATQVEFPLMLKYKSERRGNSRMYLIGGINPSFEAKGRNDEEGDEKLSLKDSNLAIEFGFGIDIYYPFFKFSPEIRFSKGITNLRENNNSYSLGLERVTTNTVTLYLQFSD